MKFSTSKEDILPSLQLISGVVEKKQTLPILSHVLLEVNGNSLTITGTDLELELETTIKIKDNTDGKATISARKIFDIVRSLSDKNTIDIKADDNTIYLASGKSRFSLGALNVDDFPKTTITDTGQKFCMQSKVLKNLVDKTMFSMAIQDVRYYLNGILFETEGKNINVVATDGHRLAIASEEQDINFKEKNQVIIPRKTVIELSKLLSNAESEISLNLGKNHISVKDGSNAMTSKLIDGRYPDYQRVIPDDVTNIAIFNREKLKSSLMRTAILSNEKYRGIRINFTSGTAQISANNPEQEEAHDEVEVNYAGDDVEIGFNVSYLLDAINAVESKDLKFLFKDASSSCIIQNEKQDYPLYVVMPMRL